MSDKLEKRVEQLEKRSSSGPPVTVFLYDENWEMLPEAEQKRKLAAAEVEAGPNGVVFAVRIEED